MIESLTARAACTSPLGPYTTTVESARGARVRLQQLSDRGRFLAVTDGTDAWSIDEDGTAEPGGESLRLTVLNHDFQMLALEPERLTAPLRDAGGALAGFETRDSRDERRVIVVRFLAWTEVEGERLPHRVTVTSHEGEFVLDFDHIEANGVDASIFVRPW